MQSVDISVDVITIIRITLKTKQTKTFPESLFIDTQCTRPAA